MSVAIRPQLNPRTKPNEFTFRIATGADGVQYTSPNLFQFTFRNGWPSSNEVIALEALYINYSWRNITAALGNNTFTYIINGVTQPTITIPDGTYQYSDFNTYLQQVMVANGHYLVDNNGNNVYFLSVQANSVAYAVLIQATPIPSVLPTGWSNPAALTLSGTCPQLVVPAGGFATYLGFNAGSYPPTAQVTAYSQNGQTIPQVSNVTTVNVTCSVLGLNPITSSNILATFTPSQTGATPGSLISYVPLNLDFMPVGNGTYSTITLGLTNQLNQPIQIYDTTGIVFVLKVKNAFAL